MNSTKVIAEQTGTIQANAKWSSLNVVLTWFVQCNVYGRTIPLIINLDQAA